MKRLAFALGLVAATAFAAPLTAQSRNGPWWDPGNTAGRTTSGRTDTRNGSIYNDGRVDSRADGKWRAQTRDRNGDVIYVRTRYDSNGNLVREWATRNFLHQYRVIDRRVLRSANNRNGRYNDDYDDDRYGDRQNGRDRNDRWDQNGGHDNGKHNGWYKNKNHGKGRGRNR
jgi:hypothetical protein